MQSTNAPSKTTIPFAASGAKNTVPTLASGVSVSNQASYESGFPSVTMTAPIAGGKPPMGKDFNGILNAITQAIKWANLGGLYTYDSAYATDSNVGGYPKGAVLLKSVLAGFWQNTVENNTSNPDAGGAGWVDPFANYLDLTTAASNYAPIHSNLSAFNNDSGYVLTSQFGNSYQILTGSTGYKIFPGPSGTERFIVQWGNFSSTGGTASFPLAFPNTCIAFVAGNKDAQGSGSDVAFGYPVSTSQFYIATKPSSGGLSGFPASYIALGY